MIDLARRIYSSEALKKAAGTRVVVAGWAADIKRIGKIAFVRLRDREGEIQLTALPDFEKMSELEKIPKESVIVAEGKMAESKLKSGEKELVLEKFEVISKSEPVLPIDFSGKIPTGLDKRLDNRLLDLRN
ncbi:MAG: OB-fold nucleic acid binding domain-containing protein, partial [Candidatus Woesearchaeota archaeon]